MLIYPPTMKIIYLSDLPDQVRESVQASRGTLLSFLKREEIEQEVWFDKRGRLTEMIGVCEYAEWDVMLDFIGLCIHKQLKTVVFRKELERKVDELRHKVGYTVLMANKKCLPQEIVGEILSWL